MMETKNLVRSQLLEMSRNAGKKGGQADLRSTSVLNELADAALKDITNSNIPENILAEFTLQRNFSKNLNNEDLVLGLKKLLGLSKIGKW